MATPRKDQALCTGVSVTKIHMCPRNFPIYCPNKCNISAILTVILPLPSPKKGPLASLSGRQASNTAIPISFPSADPRKKKGILTLKIMKPSELSFVETSADTFATES